MSLTQREVPVDDATEIWPLVHAERAALAADLANLTDDGWTTPSLCSGLTVREVLAHLTSAATLTPLRWMWGVVRCRFDFDKQVAMRLAEQLGATPGETLERFRGVVTSTTSPPLPVLAMLGETVVHGQDIRRPLGIRRDHPVETLTRLARYYSTSDMVVLAKGRIEGLRLVATDGPFATDASSAGSGPLVTGTTLALIMAMTGRGVYCDDLDGDGVATLRGRCAARPVLERAQIDVAVRAERLSLCDFLDGLDDSGWATQSLCSAWTVRDVVAHLTTTTRETLPFVVKAAIRARGSFDRMTVDVAGERAARYTTGELVAQLRESAGTSRRMPGSGPMDPLMDLLIHGQDIARPLGRRYVMRPELAAPSLAYVAGSRFLGGPRRLAGLELVATDVSWGSGRGPRVQGTAEDLLLVAAGRAAGLAGLTGPGVEILAGRLAAG
ncbi:MAG: maleylpyruvate isomerase family mycothiol-dependent enzyme [Pseudonocardia sp.]